MSRLTATIAMLEDIRDTAVAGINALIEDLESGGLPQGEYEGEEPPADTPDEPPAEDPPVDEPPAEEPAPPPAEPKPPVVTNLRQHVEGLRDRSTPNGIMDKSRLKVVGQDPLPKGVTFNDRNVVIETSFNGDIPDQWDLGQRRLIVKGTVGYMAGFLAKDWAGNGTSLFEIQTTARIDLLEDFELHGTYGNGGCDRVMWHRVSGPGMAAQAGIVGHVRRGRFEGFDADHVKLSGSIGGTVYEDMYHGPRWKTPGSSAHPDVYTTVSVIDRVRLKNILVDWQACPDPAYVGGTNNSVRAVRNKGSDKRFDALEIEGMVAYHRPDIQSFTIQAGNGGMPNYNGPIRFRDSWFQANANSKHFHGSTNGLVEEWVNVRDTITDALIAPPSGARVA